MMCALLDCALKGKGMPSPALSPISLLGMGLNTHAGELSWTLKTRTTSRKKAEQLKGCHLSPGVLILGQFYERNSKLLSCLSPCIWGVFLLLQHTCSRQNVNMVPKISCPTVYTPCISPKTVNMTDFASLIRLYYMTYLTVRKGDYPDRPGLTTF